MSVIGDIIDNLDEKVKTMDEKIKEVHKLYIKAQEKYQTETAFLGGNVHRNFIEAQERLKTLVEVMRILDPENRLDI